VHLQNRSAQSLVSAGGRWGARTRAMLDGYYVARPTMKERRT
jgi:hypothetical protein